MSEIKLVNVDLENPIILSSDYVNLLIIENSFEFYKTVSKLIKQFNGEEGDYICLIDSEIVPIEKAGDIVYNFFDWNINNKKLLNILYKEIENNALSEKMSDFLEASSAVNKFISDLISEFPFQLNFNDLSVNELLKSISLKFENDYENIEEKIICYVNAIVELKHIKFLVLVNLKSIMTDEKLTEFYKYCHMEEVPLFLIESKSSRALLPSEKAIIITEDLCEIVAT